MNDNESTQNQEAAAVQHDSDEISLGDDDNDDDDNNDHDGNRGDGNGGQDKDEDDNNDEGSESGANAREQQQQQQQQDDVQEDEKVDSNPMEKEELPSGSSSSSTTNNNIPPSKKMTPIQKRMYELKLKMNQSRQLNRREVMEEGQRLSSFGNYKKQQRQQDKKSLKEEWETSITSKSVGVSEKERQALCQSATDFQKKSSKKQSKADMNRYAVDDHYNPEGQFRNYERNLKSVPRSSRGASSEQEGDDQIFNPIEATIGGGSGGSSAQERQGARRLANELHRRQAKSKESRDKRSREDAIEGDVAYINQRNKKFNQKISRNFDKHTAEIRHNLERGTAS